MASLRKLPIEGVPPELAQSGSGKYVTKQARIPNLEPHVADDLETFIKNGWVFVEREDDSVSKPERSPVYIDRDRRVKIGTNKCIVRFKPNVSLASIKSILANHHLVFDEWVIKALNVVHVVPDESVKLGQDAVVRMLEDEPSVQYAEPVLLEAMARR